MVNISNPHQENIDPNDGNRNKIIFKMTKGLEDEDKFDLTSIKTSNVRDQVEKSAHAFFFGSVLFNVPKYHDEEGIIIETGNCFRTERCDVGACS